MPSLSEQIHDECREVINNQLGRISSASLVRSEDGQFAYPYLDDEGVEEHPLSDDVHNSIETALETLQQLFQIDDGVPVTTSQAVDWVPESDSVYVAFEVTHERSADDDITGYVTNAFAASHSRAEADRITSVECYRDVYPHQYTDGTVSFRTDTPHETIANVDSFDEYVEWRAANSDMSVEEVRAQDDYSDHFHPSDSTVITDVCQQVARECFEAITAEKPARKAATGARLNVGDTVAGTVLVYARVDELGQQTED